MSGAQARVRPVLSLADLSHVGVKLLGTYACNAYPHSGLKELTGDLIAAFGPSRLCGGSDFSPALDYMSFAQTIEAFQKLAGLSNRAIFSRNLQNIIRRVRRAGVDS